MSKLDVHGTTWWGLGATWCGETSWWKTQPELVKLGKYEHEKTCLKL